MANDLVFLDIETTGLDKFKHETWEAAWAINDEPINQTFLKHNVDRADPEALSINGYHDRITKFDKSWDQGEELLYSDLKDNTVVAANPSFDTGFLESRWHRSTTFWLRAEPWLYRKIDIEVYAMPLLQLDRPRGLAYIADALEVEAPDHTAYNDVYTLRECFKILRDSYLGQF